MKTNLFCDNDDDDIALSNSIFGGLQFHPNIVISVRIGRWLSKLCVTANRQYVLFVRLKRYTFT